jgi:hypothetical protein
MSAAPDPESVSTFAKMIGAAAAIFGPIGVLWGYIDSRFAKKHTVNNQLHHVESEIAIHRGYFKDVFEKLEEHGRRDEDHFRSIELKSEERHRELMMHLLEQRK